MGDIRVKNTISICFRDIWLEQS